MNTIASTASGGRARRFYSASFKAELVAQCRQVGVSSAAIAISHSMNPNVLRRWIKESESVQGAGLSTRKAMTLDEATPAFVALMPEALHIQTPAAVAPAIEIEVQRNGIIVSVTWPVSQAAESAAWVREILR